MGEVNDIFQGDDDSLKAFAAHLKTYRWFKDNQQMVRWQESKRRVNLSSEANKVEKKEKANIRKGKPPGFKYGQDNKGNSKGGDSTEGGQGMQGMQGMQNMQNN